MKLEHKIGISITCTFLCMTGAVIGLKMQERTPLESPSLAISDPVEVPPATPKEKGPDPDSFGGNDAPPQVNPVKPAQIKAPPPPPPTTPLPPRGSGKEPSNPVNPPSTSSNLKQNASAGKDKPPANPSTTSDLTLSQVQQMLSGPGGSPPSPQVEKNPTKPPMKGDKQWDLYPSGSGASKTGAQPAPPVNSPNPPSPLLNPAPQTKSQETTNNNGIRAASAIEPSKPTPWPQPSRLSALPSPASAGGPSLTPPTASNSGPAASSSRVTLPSFLQDPPANSPKSSIPTAKANPSPPPPSPPAKPADAPGTSLAPIPPPTLFKDPLPPPTAPSPSPTAPPIPLPSASPPSPPAAAPAPSPMFAPIKPPPPAAPTLPAAPPPPTPPAEGSTFIPDLSSAEPARGGPSSSSVSGSAGVRPAPLPLPTMPLQPTPLASSPAAPAPRQPDSNGASVKVYDEQVYTCRRGDTWEEISKIYYKTDRYAKALQRHNQFHPRASDQMAGSGQPGQGERIFVPQAYILEGLHADAIPPKPAAPPSSTVVPTSGVMPPPNNR